MPIHRIKYRTGKLQIEIPEVEILKLKSFDIAINNVIVNRLNRKKST